MPKSTDIPYLMSERFADMSSQQDPRWIYTLKSAKHDLRMLRELHELNTSRVETIKFEKAKEYLRPILLVDDCRGGEINSIQDVVNFWPDNGEEVTLLWNIDGFSLKGTLLTTPTQTEPGGWLVTMTGVARRDKDQVSSISTPIDVIFDETPRPPSQMISAMIEQIETKES